MFQILVRLGLVLQVPYWVKWLGHDLVCRRHLTITTNLVTLYCGTLANIRIHSERQNLHLSYSVPTLFNPKTSMTSLANIRPYGLNTSSTPIASLHFLAHLTVLPRLAILTAMSISLPAFSRIAAIGNASARMGCIFRVLGPWWLLSMKVKLTFT